ncbi:hypothetical protein [Streptomyces sp. CBG33]|uniref:hypothetical protein n=1 Tax=Streptomyces sp. CBG33 TaxID=2762624 RepID=UPI001644D994|nr:hypothetical protein [Streptomyces sp. CBG33]
MAITGNRLPETVESIETDASGWTPVTNCQTPTRGSGGVLGSYCLSFRSVAAGDCRIEVMTPVLIATPGESFACATIYPPAAGIQLRLEIRWYNAGGTLVSTTTGPTVTSTGAAWHQAGALASAPFTAVRATVALRVTATTANQSFFADRIFLGDTPEVSPGNLLPFNHEQVEVDASGWAAASNVSITAQYGGAYWYSSLVATSSAAGSAMVRAALSTAPAVTAGAEYVASAYVSPTTAGLSHRMEIYWRSADGTELGATSQTWSVPAGSWTKIACVGLAPPGATLARVAMVQVATASGQQVRYDRMVLAPTSALAIEGSLLPYTVADMEAGLDGWAVAGATAALSTTNLSGAYSMRLTATGGDLEAVTAVPVTGVEPGHSYQFRPAVRRGTGDRPYRTRMEWVDASGEVLRTRWQGWSGGSGVWYYSSMADVAPANTVGVRLALVVEDALPGEQYYMDTVALVEGGLVATAEPADGGGVAITARGLTAGGPTWRWALYRLVAGQPQQPVRGWSGDLENQPITSDVTVITDYEAPLGVPVQYRVRLTQVSGGSASLSYITDPVTLDAETLDVWIKDPGQPARSCRATVQTLPEWQRDARQGVHYVKGRARPIVISDVRSSRTGSLGLVTRTTSERDALWWVLESGATLLIQWPPDWGESDVYVSVGDVTEGHITGLAEHHDRVWTLALTEVDRPIGGIVGSASRTWQTVADSGPDWATVLAGAGSWLDVYSGEGA